MIKSLPPLHEIAAMTGVNLPSYLGDLEKNKSVKPEIVIEDANKETKKSK